MVIDTSALIAILGMETEAPRLVIAIAAADTRLVSAATIVEAGRVMESRHGSQGGLELDLLVAKAGLVVEPVTAAQAVLARDAWRRFGKGRHGAALNFGDCFSYALAQATGEPLLYKGDDFSRTDIVAVRY